MDVTTLPKVPGRLKRRKRLGRGVGSGHGKTSTRGQKGQRARTGEGKKPGFEGGRTPLIRKIPKRGFRVKSTGHELQRGIVNVAQLNRFRDGERIAPEQLQEAGLVRYSAEVIKLLGDGELSKRLTVAVHEASVSATAKVTAAGGTVELLTRSKTA
jgi:large subunit ribosomal protein L15